MKINRRKFLSTSAKAAATLAALQSGLIPAFAEASLAINLASDPRRPQYHLLPARNWMNDPNGPIFWKGRYHMFFQYNPNAAVWGDMHWYHSISPDMVHWKHLPVALAPGGPDTPDSAGCFSGTTVVNNGTPTFIYTGVAKASATEATLRDGNSILKETQLLATSTDPELKTWTKRRRPVIPTPPKGLEVTGFRDPAPWKQGDTWLMAVGSGEKGKGGMILLYKSADLQNWEYLHPLIAGTAPVGTGANPVDTGEMWECPDFFVLGNRHVLIYSTQGKVFWQVGDFDLKELVFHPQQTGWLDYGTFYAPKTQLDKSGNRILWGWIPETRPTAEYSASGWAGLVSLPRVLTLGPENQLRITPAPAFQKLRQRETKLQLAPAEPGSKILLSSPGLKDACGEILCTLNPTEPFTLDLLTPIDKKDAKAVESQVSLLSIRYSHANPGEIIVDQQKMPIHIAAGVPLELHLYIDGSVIELFANNESTYTKRFYYPGLTAPEIVANITGKTSDIVRLVQYQITPISKDRLTT